MILCGMERAREAASAPLSFRGGAEESCPWKKEKMLRCALHDRENRKRSLGKLGVATLHRRHLPYCCDPGIFSSVRSTTMRPGIVLDW